MASVTVRIDEVLVEPYRIRAEAQDRSLSAEVRQALRRDLARDQRAELVADGHTSTTTEDS